MNLAKRIGAGLAAAFFGVAGLTGCVSNLQHDAAAESTTETQTSEVTTNNEDVESISAKNFDQEVLKSSKPVLVEFYADGCHWCDRVAPAVKEIAHEKTGSIKVVKVDVRASQKLARTYGAYGTPTFIIFRDGNPIGELPGAAPKGDLVKWIDDSLALPAGTKFDLKVKTLSDNDKQRLRDAFESAVNKSPDADTTFKAPDGSPTTLRKSVEADLNNGTIFDQAETALNTSPITLDQIIAQTQQATFTVAKPAPRA